MILVYDVSSRVSFENLSGWLEEVDQFIGTRPVVKVLVSNKTDRERKVTKKEASEWAGEHELQLFETSAKAQEGVSDLFEAIVKQVRFASSILSDEVLCTIIKMSLIAFFRW